MTKEKQPNTSRVRKTKKIKKNPKRKPIKKSTKRNNTQSGGTTQPYFYIPVSKNGQLLSHSIESIHIQQFLKCLHKSIALQNLLQKHYSTISSYTGPLYNRKIRPYLSKQLNAKTIIRQLDSEILNFTTHFVGTLRQFHQQQKKPPIPITKIQTPPRTVIRVKGGAENETSIFRSIGNFISSAVILVISSFISPHPPRSQTQFIDSDFRRTIVGIIFPETDLRCIAKCTNDDNYTEGYKKEARVYRFFERQNEPVVCPFYGAGSGRLGIGSREYITMNLPMPLKNGQQKTGATLSILVNRQRFEGQQRVPELYVLFTEWNNRQYWTLEDALRANPTPVLRNRHLQNVMDVTGYLNNKYGFYHGDLKQDNIMVRKDGQGVAVRCFDFDWSGVIQLIPNTTVISYFEPNPPTEIIGYVYGRDPPFGKIFFLILDSYRMFLSWIWELSPTKRFDVFTKKCRDGSCIKNISIKNDHISFTVQDFITYLKQFTQCRAGCTIDNVMKKIHKKYKLHLLNSKNWNDTLMNKIVVMGLFDFIVQRNFNPFKK